MRKEKLIIFGCGDIGKLAHFYFTKDSPYQVEAFVVDARFLPSEKFFCGRPVLALEEVSSAFPPIENKMFIALSYSKMNRLREAKYYEVKSMGYQLASYVSSKCSYLSEEPPGDNAFILEDNTVQPFVKIGANVTLWSGNHIGHDSTIDDHTFISSHVVVSGNCRIGKRCFLGVNSTLRNSLTIADESLIGAGVAIMKNTSVGDVYLPPKPFLWDKKSDLVDL